MKFKIILLTFTILYSLQTNAHKRWFLPNEFSVSEKQWISIDASLSNNIFYADRPWTLDGIQVIHPNLRASTISNPQYGKRKNTFEVYLEDTGTTKVASISNIYFAQFEYSVQMNEVKRIRSFDYNELISQIPENAKNIKLSKSISRLETYLTLGAPSSAVFKATGSGLELLPITHPNDVYENEAAQFKFLVDGKPQKNIKVSLVWEGTRYRNDESEITFITNEQGIVTFTPDKPGAYLLEASYKGKSPDTDKFENLHMSYMATLEVLPQ
ncbi:MAG: DUF4198 domain-containing protein [Gammaproteobacteria bacterium]|nr:DUF4198 domain-containing protein [Xanthomonadales bacterium]